MLEFVLVGPVDIPLYKMSQESHYMVLCVDPVTNRFFFLSSEGKKVSKTLTGALVKMATDWQGNNLTVHSVQSLPEQTSKSTLKKTHNISLMDVFSKDIN